MKKLSDLVDELPDADDLMSECEILPSIEPIKLDEPLPELMPEEVEIWDRLTDVDFPDVEVLDVPDYSDLIAE